MVDTYGKNLGVRFQGRQRADRNRQSDALDRVEPMVQAGAQTLHSAFLLRLWNLLVLHDDLYGLFARRTPMGSRNCRSEVRGEFSSRPAGRPLGERGLRNQEQQQHAQAFSPSRAVALASARALLFSCM